MKALKKGFTLIELIVVIAILAILALLIVPQVTGYVDNANDAVAKANAKTCYSDYLAKVTANQAGLASAPATTPADGCTITNGRITTSKAFGTHQYYVDLNTGTMTDK